MSSGPFRRILVGWDASPAAHTALATAFTLADGDGVVIARAVLAPPRHVETSGEGTRELDAQRRWLSEQYDSTVRSATPHGARARLEWSESTDIPADLCAGAEDHGCDLIVVGRHGENGHLRTTGLGPVARAVPEGTHLPVLLVSPAADL
ncbi:universal stress protein [Streptomyces sp. HNM0575]|uniref:universal stress protein n=1 Tax=Streptomyces sp. HNM0575 TaxID=2716338 RepID=UPI00145F1BCB|nr:universal stress protein [Streptomyces sp. HNM0575]NLU76677.1 universal stress protein [Streptomyces sp. HNM0575]